MGCGSCVCGSNPSGLIDSPPKQGVSGWVSFASQPLWTSQHKGVQPIWGVCVFWGGSDLAELTLFLPGADCTHAEPCGPHNATLSTPPPQNRLVSVVCFLYPSVFFFQFFFFWLWTLEKKKRAFSLPGRGFRLAPKMPFFFSNLPKTPPRNQTLCSPASLFLSTALILSGSVRDFSFSPLPFRFFRHPTLNSRNSLLSLSTGGLDVCHKLKSAFKLWQRGEDPPFFRAFYMTRLFSFFLFFFPSPSRSSSPDAKQPRYGSDMFLSTNEFLISPVLLSPLLPSPPHPPHLILLLPTA